MAGALADPQLELYAGSSKLFANDDWANSPALAATAARVGAFALPAASRDSALVTTLAPGAYTAQVSGANHSAGIALVEVYDVP